jgi:hypothetical protein
VDDRIAEVRIAVLPCMICDPWPDAELERAMVQSERGWREAASGEIQRAGPGEERRLLLRASGSTRAYGLQYRLTERDGEAMRASIDVLVRPDPPRYKPPFWVAERLAREERRP